MSKILIVDDEESVRALLSRLLALHGYTVDVASDGVEAVDAVQKAHYDLMLIDQHMPKMSGREAVEIIRTSPKFKTLKILMVTLDNLTKDIEDAYEQGIDGYVIKPFDMSKLLKKIERTLQKQS